MARSRDRPQAAPLVHGYSERLSHYFSTYKLIPGEDSELVIEGTYDHRHAWEVVAAAIEDYEEAYCR